MKDLEKHSKGWNMHSQTLKDMGYTMLGWRNDDAFVIPEGRKFHSVRYDERCKTLYICLETKEYYMLDSGD